MSLYPTPEVVYAKRWLTVPSALRKRETVPEWSDANRGGRATDCFLEGPVFDNTGHLWLTDIPYGRIFRITPAGVWELMAEYDGWPNGLAVHPDGRIFIADYRQGILVLDPKTLVISSLFKGVVIASISGDVMMSSLTGPEAICISLIRVSRACRCQMAVCIDMIFWTKNWIY
ncbi:MAG: hypothetical protein CM1200mP41_37840 [Gammaproteobacteria bacterium]|nr:MAG: hypothetical protein CM1200mP41_37840 [Gammaproteobacteria bacterium]